MGCFQSFFIFLSLLNLIDSIDMKKKKERERERERKREKKCCIQWIQWIQLVGGCPFIAHR